MPEESFKTPKAFDSDGVQYAWDSTSIKLAEECLRKYEYKMVQGWRPQSKSVHLLFGGWYASALESYHNYRANGMSDDEATEEVVLEALIETWEYPNCPDCNGPDTIAASGKAEDCVTCGGDGKLQEGGTPWLSDHNTKTRENLIRTIVWYLDHFRDDSATTVILSSGKAAVEHSFALPVDNGIIFSGHLDRLVNYAGGEYVMDQKTTGTTITSRFFDSFSPDTQMSMYTWAGQMIFDRPLKGVIIDGAQIAVGFTRFERGFTFRTNSQLEEWYDHTLTHIETAMHATRENHFPMNTTSCGNYGGCEFRHICSRSPQVREQFLKADYVRGERWDPLKAR